MQAREISARDPDRHIYDSLEPLIRGLGMSLIELSVYRSKGRNVQVKLVVMAAGIVGCDAPGNPGRITGIDDCSRVHRAIMPRLELAFPEQDVYLEVSSPGIDRLIKDISEFAIYIGKKVRCYRTDITEWTQGILKSANEEGIELNTKE